MGRLDDRVAIITGGASGIGRATARRCAADGAAVVVADIDTARADETVALIEAEGGRALAQFVDVADEGSVEAMVAATVEAFGAVHLLHNNAVNVAAVALDHDVVSMRLDVWEDTMAVNLRGPMLCAKHTLPHMLDAGRGSIVNMSSSAGQAGDLSRVAYGTSKGGLESFTRYVATLYGRGGVRCNAVAPGAVRTPALTANVAPEEIAILERHHLTPYLGEPEDLAAVVAFLFSDDARFITGQVVNANGGLLGHSPDYADHLDR